jgi:hypothetical protein
MAKETATAASTARRRLAHGFDDPAARRCAAATTPPRGTTLCTDLARKLSMTAAIARCAREANDAGVRGKPDPATRFGVTDQFLQDPHPRAVTGMVRVHGELEYAALLPGHVEPWR